MIVKSAGTVPVPVSALVCGDPAALSATDSVAPKLPAPEGVNVTAIVQFAPAASADPQADVSAKALAFAPPSVTPEIASGALPEFVSVNVCAVLVVPAVKLPKFAVAGVSVAAGAAGTAPLQLNATDNCGSGEGKFAPRLAVCVPAVAGVHVIEIVQLAPAARLAPQLLVSLNELVLLPKNPKLLIPCGTPPVLLNVAFCTALVVPTFTLPKLILAGVSSGCGPCAAPSPVPLRLIAPPPVVPTNVAGPVTSVPESVNGPSDGGVNVYPRSQLLEGATVVPGVVPAGATHALSLSV